MAALLPVLPTPVHAQDDAEQADRWAMSAELSYTDQSGNQVLRLLTGGFNVSHRETDQFEFDASVKSRYGQSDGEVVARNHYGSMSFDLHPNDLWSPFLYADAERDPFKRLDLRFSGGAGAKYTPYQPEGGAGEVSLSLALLYAHEDFRPQEGQAEQRNRHLARWSMRVRGNQRINDGVTLQHTSFYQPQLGHVADYLLRSETGAKVLLTERLALSIQYQYDRTNLPPEGVHPDDRLFKTGLIISF